MVVASFAATKEAQLMLVTDQAKLIRLPIEFRHLLEGGYDQHKGFSIIGRSSSGVKIFDVAKGEHIVGAALIEDSGEDEADAVSEDTPVT
jgi:DNA gyrase subunit A